MAGSLLQRGDNVFRLRVYAGRDAEGRKKWMTRTFHGSKRDAQRELAALVTEVATSVPERAGGAYSYGAYLDRWLAHKELELSPKGISVARGYVETCVRPALGNVPLTKLSTVDIDEFYARLRTVGGQKGPYTAGTVRRIHAVVRSSLSQAVKWQLIRYNPATEASPPKVYREEPIPPEPSDVATIFKAAQKSNPDFATFVVLAAATGARRGELCALRWSDIDMDKGLLDIRRGIVSVSDEEDRKRLVEKDTKTHASRRLMLDEKTLEYVKIHRIRWEERARLCEIQLDDDAFLFSNEADASAPWWPDSATRAFRYLVAELTEKRKIKRMVRLHDLRHYVATQLLGAGVDVVTVQKRLGHRNASTTLNVYSHAIPGTDGVAAKTMGEMFDEALKTTEGGS